MISTLKYICILVALDYVNPKVFMKSLYSFNRSTSLSHLFWSPRKTTQQETVLQEEFLVLFPKSTLRFPDFQKTRHTSNRRLWNVHSIILKKNPKNRVNQKINTDLVLEEITPQIHIRKFEEQTAWGRVPCWESFLTSTGSALI